LAAGEDFAALAGAYSKDIITQESGGDFGAVDKTSRTVSQKAVDTLYSLELNQVSDEIIVPYGTGSALALIKYTEEVEGGDRRGSHIIIPLQNVDEMLNDIKAERPYRLYISRPADETAETP
ncbi:MAG: peptidylprolyl isomerase, partial [Anaerorhabdus sp.]